MARPYYLIIAKYHGIYKLATYRQFRNRADAELQTQSIAVDREPIIVLVD